MKIRLDRKLKPFVHAQLHAEMASNPDADRKQLLIEIVSQFLRAGNAERFCRKSDGCVAYRCTHAMLEQLAEEEAECDFND